MEMVKPPCRSGHCSICYGSISNTPRYMRDTVSSRTRLANTRRFYPYRSSKQNQEQPSGLSKSPSLFLQLPLEIRLLIYAFCLRRPPEMETERHVCHWVEGGAWHHDDPLNRRLSPFALEVYGIVPASLLRVNKQIHREATREVYRLTSVHLLHVTPACFPVLDYWLHEHPLRYTRFLTIERVRISNHGLLRIDTSSVTYLRHLVRIFNAMPNLEDLLVNVEGLSKLSNSPCLHLPSDWIPSLLRTCDALRENITLRLRFNAHVLVYGIEGFTGMWREHTVARLVKILQRKGFSLAPSSHRNVSDVRLPFEMTRFCGNTSSTDKARVTVRTRATHGLTEYKRYV